MYAIAWDPETNGIILKPAGENDIPPTIRPVFFEELDLLGFGEFWEYERTEEPLLWCPNRTYYYRGEQVARAVGGSFFEKPKLEIYKEGLVLEPAIKTQLNMMDREYSPYLPEVRIKEI